MFISGATRYHTRSGKVTVVARPTDTAGTAIPDRHARASAQVFVEAVTMSCAMGLRPALRSSRRPRRPRRLRPHRRRHLAEPNRPIHPSRRTCCHRRRCRQLAPPRHPRWYRPRQCRPWMCHRQSRCRCRRSECLRRRAIRPRKIRSRKRPRSRSRCHPATLDRCLPPCCSSRRCSDGPRRYRTSRADPGGG